MNTMKPALFLTVAFILGCGAGKSEPTNKQLCADGSGPDKACFEYGMELVRDGSDIEQAVQRLEGACRGGNTPAACFEIGVLYRDDEPPARDDRKARTFFAMGCDSGDAASCANQGVMLLTGEGTNKPNLAQAEKLMKRGCDGDVNWACKNLGPTYYDGGFGSVDVGKAVAALTKGCDLDDGPSCGALAELYDKGTGTTADPGKAAELRKKSCDLGHQFACNK